MLSQVWHVVVPSWVPVVDGRVSKIEKCPFALVLVSSGLRCMCSGRPSVFLMVIEWEAVPLCGHSGPCVRVGNRQVYYQLVAHAIKRA